VIGGYVQRRILGLPPFEDDGTRQFAAPEEKQAPRRKWTRKERLERLGGVDESASSEPVPELMSEVQSEEIPVQEKTEE
jgi:hypothetical protein